MSSLFYYTGVVVWVIIGFIAVSVFFVVFWTLWDRDISPSLANLRFAVFGKPWSERCSYYQLWRGMPKWHYRYYKKGRGNKHFARCAMRRLIREARRESKASGRRNP